MGRVLILVPDYIGTSWAKTLSDWQYRPRGRVLKKLGAFRLLHMRSIVVTGGILNLMRHCRAAREAGLEAYMASESGKNTYAGIDGVPQLEFVKYGDHRADDLCVFPDIYSHLVPQARCGAIVYEQHPAFVRADFDPKKPRVAVWTDSPMMVEVCSRVLPGVDAPIVPNIVDHLLFPFVPQSERKDGELIAFPRKGAEFIQAAMNAYEALGGRYWKLNLVDGLSIGELGRRFRTPQAFLASADVEGCALPPQECMASGIVVVGKDANGANFVMQHDRTALVGNTAEEVARQLLRAEAPELRQRVSEQGYALIQRYFSHADPAELWKSVARDPRWA